MLKSSQLVLVVAVALNCARLGRLWRNGRGSNQRRLPCRRRGQRAACDDDDYDRNHPAIHSDRNQHERDWRRLAG